MKSAIPTIVAVTLAVVGAITYRAESARVTVEPAAQQPQREPYVAPVWVTNERGQRCIQQGDTVTCG